MASGRCKDELITLWTEGRRGVYGVDEGRGVYGVWMREGGVGAKWSLGWVTDVYIAAEETTKWFGRKRGLCNKKGAWQRWIGGRTRKEPSTAYEVGNRSLSGPQSGSLRGPRV